MLSASGEGVGDKAREEGEQKTVNKEVIEIKGWKRWIYKGADKGDKRSK